MGYAGRILRINLSNGCIKKEPLAEGLVRKYLGGKGIATWLLYNEVKPGIDPLSPENKLFFATGPATGTIVPHKGYIVTFKSPQTWIYASASSGGFFADELKRAGYDVLVIEGRAKDPVYVWIDDENVHLMKANHLWGRDTFETNAIVKEELGDEKISVARIGIAGEKLVRFSSILNDYSRTAGRCGSGAVMGSKNLKAIAVRGSSAVKVARIDELIDFVKGLQESVTSDRAFPVMTRWGTTFMIDAVNLMGVHPTRYWHKGSFKDYEKIDAETIEKKMMVKNKACCSCSMPCGKLLMVNGGAYAGTFFENDYEPLWALGSNCENSSLEAVVKAAEMCDRLGMDVISAGNLVAFAMDCYEHRFITSHDTDGIELTWGDPETIILMVDKIGRRTGLGDVLAEGVRIAAKRIGKGAEALAVHIKGLESPGFDPRGMKGLALAFGVSDRGACHCTGSMHVYETRGDYFGEPVDRLAVEGKAKIVKEVEDRGNVADCFVFCRIYREVYPWETIMELIPLLTGFEMSINELRSLGERIVNLSRTFSVKEGVSRKDDYWPDRFFKEPILDGASQGCVLDKGKFDTMLDQYYESRGWDSDGIPKRERLIQLGLEDVADHLEPFRKKQGV
jgi:aldehyde:ferredoxin oxidoreductase